MNIEQQRIEFAILVLAKAIESGRIIGVVADMEEILKLKVDFLEEKL